MRQEFLAMYNESAQTLLMCQIMALARKQKGNSDCQRKEILPHQLLREFNTSCVYLACSLHCTYTTFILFKLPMLITVTLYCSHYVLSSIKWWDFMYKRIWFSACSQLSCLCQFGNCYQIATALMFLGLYKRGSSIYVCRILFYFLLFVPTCT